MTKISTALSGIALCVCTQLTLADEPIRIAVTGPYSGPSSPMGQSMLAGVRLAISEMNLGGGLLGRQLALVEKDDKGDPATGKQVVDEAIRQDKVVAGLGFINTGVALAALKTYQEARLPVIVNVATGSTVARQFAPPAVADSYVFRNSASDDIQAAMIVREAVKRGRYSKLAIFHDSTPYGEQGRDQLTRELATQDLKPVAVESFNPGTRDLSAALQRARDAGAEAILTYAIGPELAVIANGRARLGWKVPMIGSWPLSLPNFIEAAGKNAEGARMPQTFVEAPNNYRRTAFISAYHHADGSKRIPSAVSAAQGYDSALLLIAAISQAGSTEGPKIRAALENLQKPVYGVITTYSPPFTKDDHEALSDNMVLMGEVKQGKVGFAHPDDEKRSLLVHRKPKTQPVN
ncbi:ABC transporter substrate-binding protein [Dechloromonas sp. XY25]|uniref:ABC transporter substrate-binding protein n=1 Tax=Dechloromonas hankyongensis TaxID=2908002 RepID=A0ABS9K2H7_9RHOO|nr:ABC transporter substrate-binding protein [Dechloromonas hankyongensis]MCG2577353.1 ABC transporter substrate-binding protein [Dechloromonas hankyongensis]